MIHGLLIDSQCTDQSDNTAVARIVLLFRVLARYLTSLPHIPYQFLPPTQHHPYHLSLSPFFHSPITHHLSTLFHMTPEDFLICAASHRSDPRAFFVMGLGCCGQPPGKPDGTHASPHLLTALWGPSRLRLSAAWRSIQADILESFPPSRLPLSMTHHYKAHFITLRAYQTSSHITCPQFSSDQPLFRACELHILSPPLPHHT
jgi:hypothetical protein